MHYDHEAFRLNLSCCKGGLKDNVDAVVASCTNLRMSGLLQEATDKLGIPVISSNSSLVWHIEAMLDESN